MTNEDHSRSSSWRADYVGGRRDDVGPAAGAVAVARAVMADPRDLAGSWHLTRRLSDRRIGAAGTFVGTLNLRDDGDGAVRWRESGLLTWAGTQTTAEREYLLHRAPDGWWVHFADGRPFHPWAPGSTVEHLCVTDTYRGLVRIDGPTAWRVAWRVTGPRKDQRIVTRLTRPGRAGGLGGGRVDL